MTVWIHPHARQRMGERGATAAEVRATVQGGRTEHAKFGRTRFRRNFGFNRIWNGKHFKHKQIDVFAAKIPEGWLAVTEIVKYF